MRYRDAGVDVGRADAIKARIARAVDSTWGEGVQPLPGGFAGVVSWPGGGRTGPGDASLVAATLDGVGSKLELARAAGRLGEAASDLVYHCANDLLVHGARPLAFLDYVAQARLEPAVVLELVEGLARACREVGAVMLGGETAEMGRATRAGDVVLGLASSGLHTNGYTLARRVLERSGLGLDALLPGGGGERVGEALLEPHRWYGRALAPVLETRGVHALAHVTGGGLAGNLVRVLPDGCRARIDPRAWPRPPLFRWLIEAGDIPEDDARATFNLGIGMAVVCASADAGRLAGTLRAGGETVHVIGDVAAGARGVEWSEAP